MEECIRQKIKAVFGNEYEVLSMNRLLGGAQKHTYLIRCTNRFSFVFYQWDESTSFFEYNNETAIFQSSSAVLFERNNRLMTEQGVLTPKLYFMDISKAEQPYDYAFVQYIDGPDMDFIMAKEPERLPQAIRSLTSSIDKLHQLKSPCAGQIDRLQDVGFDVTALSLNIIHQDSVYLQEADPAYADLYSEAVRKAVKLAENIQKRNEYTFIHAELGPNHVMVDKNNNAYLIDIEGAKYCDVEEENSFLKMRFNMESACIFHGADHKRMMFYHIGHCFGNLRGAITLKQKGYYDMEDVSGMIEFFHKQFEILL